MDPDYTFESRQEYDQACDAVSDQLLRCVYTSCGVNRYSECIATHSFLPDASCSTAEPYDLVAYGSDQSVCLCVLKKALPGGQSVGGLSVVRTLKGHTSPLCSLRWVSLDGWGTQAKQLLLLSLDCTGKVVCWASSLSSVVLDSSSVGHVKTGGDWYRLLELHLSVSLPSSLDASLLCPPREGCIQLAIDVAANCSVISRIVTFGQADYDGGGLYPRSLRPLLDDVDDASAALGGTIDRTPSLCLCLRTLVVNGGDGDTGLGVANALHFVFIGLTTGSTEIWCQHLAVSAETGRMKPASDFVMSVRLGGHTDWVRSLDWCPASAETSGDCNYPLPVLIASGGQDHVIRLWRMFPVDHEEEKKKKIDEGDRDAVIEKGISVTLPASVDSATTCCFSMVIVAEAVLAGHTNWVTGVAWAPHRRRHHLDSGDRQWTPQLLSSSMDKSLVVWSSVAPGSPVGVAGSDLWLESARLGYLSDTGLGFLACFWQSDEASTVHGLHFQGNLSTWSLSPEGDSSVWSPCHCLPGHVGAIADLCWAVEPPDSGCTSSPPVLFSVGADQTVRIHAAIGLLSSMKTVPNGDVDGTSDEACWMEVARSQVHGYDMTAISALSPISYVSGAGEKVVRVFTATRRFFTSLQRLSGERLNISEEVSSSLAVGMSLVYVTTVDHCCLYP